MSENRFRPGMSDMIIPAFFCREGNEEAAEQWKREHPQWFVAGTWVSARAIRPAPPNVPTSDRRKPEAEATSDPLAVFRNGSKPSVAEFRALKKERSGWYAEHAESDVSAISLPRSHPVEETSYTLGQVRSYGDPEAQVAGPFVPTGDPRIDDLHTRLVEITNRVVLEINAETAALWATTRTRRTPLQLGSAAHARFAEAVRAANLPGVRVETSFIKGQAHPNIPLNSIRTDVILFDQTGKPLAVFDYKTGSDDYMSPSRRRRIKENVLGDAGLGRGLPVYVIHVPINKI